MGDTAWCCTKYPVRTKPSKWLERVDGCVGLVNCPVPWAQGHSRHKQHRDHKCEWGWHACSTYLPPPQRLLGPVRTQTRRSFHSLTVSQTQLRGGWFPHHHHHRHHWHSGCCHHWHSGCCRHRHRRHHCCHRHHQRQRQHGDPSTTRPVAQVDLLPLGPARLGLRTTSWHRPGTSRPRQAPQLGCVTAGTWGCQIG